MFRKTALERLSSPEQLDRLLQVTGPRGWVALTALGVLLVAAVLWGLFGTVSTTIEGQGMLVRPEGVHSVVSPQAGVVENVLVRAGDVIHKDREVVRLSQPDDEQSPFVFSNHSGRVLEVLVTEGRAVQKGTALLILERLEDHL